MTCHDASVTIPACSGPRASIVVTNYNYARHLAAAIDSALGNERVQLIVVDDGSTDGSLEVLSRYGDDVEVVAQTNQGQASAFNVGFARVTAPIVFFLDADDVLNSDVVDLVEAAFIDESVVRVQFPLEFIGPAGEPLGSRMPPVGVDLPSGDLRRRLTSAPSDIPWQPTSGNAFRTSMLRRIMPMPTEPFKICADYYLSNLSPVHGLVAALREAGGGYRLHGANGHFADTWSLDAIRRNIVRTSVTHELLIDHARRYGLAGLPDDPDAVRSVTALGQRIVSLRLQPAQHPKPDTRHGLVRAGVAAALGRFDLPWPRRLVMAAWFVVVGVVPRALVPRVAVPVIAVTVQSPTALSAFVGRIASRGRPDKDPTRNGSRRQ